MDFSLTCDAAVYPQVRREELLLFLRDPANVKDLSISRRRTRLQWGVPVPGDNEHTMYVWLEALVNYLTAVGYPWKDGKGDQMGWPTDVHVVGKDITRCDAFPVHSSIPASHSAKMVDSMPSYSLRFSWHSIWTCQRP